MTASVGPIIFIVILPVVIIVIRIIFICEGIMTQQRDQLSTFTTNGRDDRICHFNVFNVKRFDFTFMTNVNKNSIFLSLSDALAIVCFIITLFYSNLYINESMDVS